MAPPNPRPVAPAMLERVVSGDAWPPQPRAGDDVQVVHVRDRGVTSSALCRRVLLWGKPVWYQDDTGQVWCPGCYRLLDVAELGRADNPHRVGLPYRAGGQLLPMAADQPPRPSREPWEMNW